MEDKKKGIVIGKFMPVHKGHIALIEFAAARCDELLVAVDEADGIIPLGLRLKWMKEIFRGRDTIKICGVRKTLPQDKEPSRRASRAWAEYLNRRFGQFDLVFSSEGYGKFVAEHMRAENVVFDLERRQVPVSGTLIREHPFGYWEYIPEVVRPYFVKRICLFGPESCGKTTMALRLAEHYQAAFVPEYARLWIEKRGGKFCFEDMDRFARGQRRTVERAAKKADKLVFSDTDAITTKLYSLHYFGRTSSLVERIVADYGYDYYLFMDIDLPWEKDPLRDAPHLRKEHREKFLRELEAAGKPYAIIRGQGEERFRGAVRVVDGYIGVFS